MSLGQDGPFEFLRAAEQRYRKILALPVEPAANGEEWTGLLFRIAETRYLASMAYIQEMVPNWEITPIPGVKPWVLGLTNLHGNLVTVLDLEGFLFGKNVNAYSANPKLMVVNYGSYQVGLVVSEVFGMKHFWSVDVAPLPRGMDKEVIPYLGVSFNRHGEHYSTFNIEELLSDKNFQTLSS